MTNDIIVVEQGRLNWRGEYCVVCYTIVDNLETADFLANEALKEYDKTRAKISKINDRIWQIVIKNEIGEPTEYFISIRYLVPKTKSEVLNLIEEIKEYKNQTNTDIW